jgi:uncharacterized membrane protein YadS
VSFTIGLAATFLSDHHGGPTLLYALLVGMAFHFLSKETAAAAGIDFCGANCIAHRSCPRWHPD